MLAGSAMPCWQSRQSASWRLCWGVVRCSIIAFISLPPYGAGRASDLAEKGISLEWRFFWIGRPRLTACGLGRKGRHGRREGQGPAGSSAEANRAACVEKHGGCQDDGTFTDSHGKFSFRSHWQEPLPQWPHPIEGKVHG